MHWKPSPVCEEHTVHVMAVSLFRLSSLRPMPAVVPALTHIYHLGKVHTWGVSY